MTEVNNARIVEIELRNCILNKGKLNNVFLSFLMRVIETEGPG